MNEGREESDVAPDEKKGWERDSTQFLLSPVAKITTIEFCKTSHWIIKMFLFYIIFFIVVKRPLTKTSKVFNK